MYTNPYVIHADAMKAQNMSERRTKRERERGEINCGNGKMDNLDGLLAVSLLLLRAHVYRPQKSIREF